jgi:hypothetical protein
MNKPHKHAALIKAWADGAVIEHYRVGFGWEECSFNTPCWSPETNYRIKPKTIKYRNYLWKSATYIGATEVICACSYKDNQNEPRENWLGFIKWLGDWVEVEV